MVEETMNNLSPQSQSSQSRLHFLNPIRSWLDDFEIRDPKMARLISRTIPAQCPFERDVKVFGRVVAHIPPLCKLNPLYEQFVGLRFRSLCYLVDECGEDIQSFC
ncbi:MAG: Mo-dependent nitrogenase C-terminal domain-containing protein [Elainellaceae cyanobacterium]